MNLLEPSNGDGIVKWDKTRVVENPSYSTVSLTCPLIPAAVGSSGWPRSCRATVFEDIDLPLVRGGTASAGALASNIGPRQGARPPSDTGSPSAGTHRLESDPSSSPAAGRPPPSSSRSP